MNQALHVARKDARHLRWILAGWAALVVARVALDTMRPTMELASPVSAIVATQLSSLLSFVELIATGLIASLLVHEDPAAGRDAFWPTRPIHPLSLAWAKVGLGLATLVVVPLCGDLLTLSLLNAETGEIVRAIPSILLVRSSMVLPLFLGAALTPSLARFAILIVGAAGGFVLVVAILTTAVLLFVQIGDSSPGPQVMNPVASTLATLVALAVSLSAFVYIYRYRLLKRAVAFGVVGFAVAAAVMLWPQRHAHAASDPGPWARDPVHTIAVVESDPPQVTDRMPFQRRDRATRQVAAPVRLEGVPDDESIVGAQVRSRFEVAGTALVSRAGEMVGVLGRANQLGQGVRALQAATGAARIWSRAEGDFAPWPVVLTVDDQQFARFAHTPGRLTADIDFHVQRYAAAASAPLQPGTLFKADGRRVAVTRVERRPDGCTVFFRAIVIPPLFAMTTYRQEEVLLRNPARRDAVRGDQDWMGSADPSPFGMLLGVALGGFSGGHRSTGHGFAVSDYSIRYPQRGVDGALVDAAWLADAELVVVAADYAGRVTRSITVENFQMVR